MEPGGQILSAKWRLLRGYRVRAGADGLSEGFGATISNVADTFFFFFSSRRRHTRSLCDWSSDVCSSDLPLRSSIELSLLDFFETKRVAVRKWVLVNQTCLRRSALLVVEPHSRSMVSLASNGMRVDDVTRSEERRVGKECRSRWSPEHEE